MFGVSARAPVIAFYDEHRAMPNCTGMTGQAL